MDNRKVLGTAGKVLGYGAAAGAVTVGIGMNKLDKWTEKISKPKPPEVIAPDEQGDLWPNPDPAVAELERMCFRNPKLFGEV